MSLQYIWNYSNALQINRRKLVGIQYTRSEIARTDLTVTKNPWRFKLDFPGQPWNTMRPIIEALDVLDAYQPQTISIGQNPNFTWLYGYQGQFGTTPTGITVSSFTGNQLVLGNLPSMPSGNVLFAPGDLLQINTIPYLYTSTTTVLRGSGSTVTVTTHRPNISSAIVSGQTVNCAEDCQTIVFCPNMPTYKLQPGAYRVGFTPGGLTTINNAIVEFDGSFELYEWLQ